MTNLYLIRHGEAYGNVEPILAGVNDKGLTARGIMQAERLRDRLASGDEIAADVLIASTMPRARQTAEIIAPALELPIIADDEVQELRLGEADGMVIAEAWERFGVPDFEGQPLRSIAPGGESWPSFMLRVAIALERITREHAGKTIVVVCHGGVVDGSFVYFMQMPTLRLPPFHMHTHNTSITHWRLGERDGVPIWQLMKYNDIAHLHGLGSRESIRWRDLSGITEQEGTHPSAPLPTED